MSVRSQVLGRLKKGLIFVLSAPAGTGKTTLVRMLTQEFSCVKESVSFTTRPPRSGEVDGVDYHYIPRQDFERRMREGDFLEHAIVFEQYYGTCKKQIEALRQQGYHVILIIDTQGAAQLQEQIPAVFIFVSPPSLDELRHRLVKRKADTPESIEKRLLWAQKEMTLSSRYDYHIVNDDLNVAYDILRSILIAEEHKV
jgi:guanylate kinase